MSIITIKQFPNISVLLFAALLSFSSCKNEHKLPIYGNRDAVTTQNADGTTQVDSVYQTITPFSFLNQDSVIITNDKFKNKIYVADFFFTSCTSICPVMHRNMKTIYDQYKDNPDLMFLSHSIDFKYDKPSVLKKYAKKLGVDGDKWQFAYGTKDDIYTIAEKSYLVAVLQDSTNRDGYIHQGWLVLVDKDRHMRGFYDGTDAKAVAQLGKDVAILLEEYKK
ncbi:SCO family protein [Pedobacter sp.]|uniref:SCO family protein n=1 Tax=Pedobacter sp. TaxID=1411316 RepID=UPI003D7F6F46